MRRWLGVFAVSWGISTSAGAVAAQSPVVYRIPVTGVIENGLAPYIARALSEAADAGAKAAILDIDTPGGRVDAAQRIADAIRGSGVPVFAYVNPRAYSAGALIALATQGIFIRPGGVIGAATPVDGQGTKASEKIVSAMRGEFRGLAESHGLDPAVAEAMVDESIEIPGITEAGKLLTLSANEAVSVGYARGLMDDLTGVLDAIGLAGATVTTPSLNWAEHLVRFLTNPLVAPMLLSLGMLGLVFEVKSGAFGLGGLVSLGSLGLFFGSNLLLGLAGWEEVLMLGLGMIAVGIEVFLLPGFGVAGILGAVLIGGATVLAMLGAAPTLGDFTQAAAILGASLIITAAVFIAWLRHIPNSTRFTGLFLSRTTQASEGFVSAPARLDLVGRTGVAVTSLRPSGTARFGEERVDVVTDGEFLDAGSAIRALRSEGYRLVVESVPEIVAPATSTPREQEST